MLDAVWNATYHCLSDKVCSIRRMKVIGRPDAPAKKASAVQMIDCRITISKRDPTMRVTQQVI